MAAPRVRRAPVISLLLVLIQLVACQNTYSVPDVTIEALSPRGFRASIPDTPGTALFVFQGNLNRNINNNAVGVLGGEVVQATNGRWIFEDPNTSLNVGDVINYYVFVSFNRVGYLKDNLSYTVQKLESRFAIIPPTGSTGQVGTQPGVTEPSAECLATVTQVRGGRPCGGQVIFEDDFSSLRQSVWRVEQYIPLSHPEYPFASYQRSRVSVSNGRLHIAPKIQQSLPGFNNESIILGELDLTSGCTSRGEECFRRVSDADILPPVATGRITSADFAFKYGIVTIRAKFPLGDWLYPELLLEPLFKKYGSSNYASGVLKIASARGNSVLRAGLNKYGNMVLYGGMLMDRQCRMLQLDRKMMSGGGGWSDQFHDYSITWTPEYIALSVDGEEWSRVDASIPLRDRFPPHCNLQSTLLSTGSKMAPFDDYFQIVLGVAAGGITEFYDDIYSSNGSPKPWRNSGRKAMLHFWQDLPNWHQTWHEPELLVDHVKVVAL